MKIISVQQCNLVLLVLHNTMPRLMLKTFQPTLTHEKMFIGVQNRKLSKFTSLRREKSRKNNKVLFAAYTLQHPLVGFLGDDRPQNDNIFIYFIH